MAFKAMFTEVTLTVDEDDSEERVTILGTFDVVETVIDMLRDYHELKKDYEALALQMDAERSASKPEEPDAAVISSIPGCECSACAKAGL